MKAGAFTPATGVEEQTVRTVRVKSYRSMKAGAFTPATAAKFGPVKLEHQYQRTLNEGGGFHPRNGCRRHRPLVLRTGVRSMKAGAFTPATRPRSGERVLVPEPASTQ